MTRSGTRVEETDVVIVGAGGAGIAAALSVVENGGRAVVVEKTSYAGGTTNFVEGTYRGRQRNAAQAKHQGHPRRRVQATHGIQPLEG